MAEWNQAVDVAYIARLLQQWGYIGKEHDPSGFGGALSPTFREGFAKWQETYRYMLNDGTNRWHGRNLVADGEIGPASMELLNTPRCGCSDTEAVEEANWPDSCRNDITVWWDLAGLNISKERSDEEMRAAYKSWYDRVELQFREVETSSARIHSHTGPLSGSTLAWSYLATNNCGSKLEQRYNTRVNWQRDRNYLQAVAAHEIGHALGCPHINNTSALMNPYITSITVPQRLDLELMQRLGYTIRTSPPTPKPPTPNPPSPNPPDIAVDVCIFIDRDGKQIGKWKMIEKVT